MNSAPIAQYFHYLQVQYNYTYCWGRIGLISLPRLGRQAGSNQDKRLGEGIEASRKQ